IYFINTLENLTRMKVTDTYQEQPFKITLSGASQFSPYSIRSVSVPKDALMDADKTEMVYKYESRMITEPVDISIPNTASKIKEGGADTTVLIVHGANPFSNTDIEAAEEIKARLTGKPVREIIETTSTGGQKYRSQAGSSTKTLFLNAQAADEQSQIKPVLWNIFNMREFNLSVIETASNNMPEISENFNGVKVRYHEAVLYERDRTSPKYYTFKTNTEKAGNATPEAFVEGDTIWLLGAPYTILGIDSHLEEIVLGVKMFEGSIGLNQPVVYKSLQIELIQENGETLIQFYDKEDSKRYGVQTRETIYFKNVAVRIKETLLENGETTSLTIYNSLKEIQNGGKYEGYTIDWREVDPNNLFAAYNGPGELTVHRENYNRVAEYGAIYGIRMKGADNKIGSNIRIESDAVVFTTPATKSYTTEVYEREVRILTDEEFNPDMLASSVYIIGGPAVNEEWGWLSPALEKEGTKGFTLRNEYYKLEDYKPYMMRSIFVDGTVYTACAGVDRLGTYRSVFGRINSLGNGGGAPDEFED
ncbi:hypothetical protein KKA03_01940, partial [archaeon]|nr:hypothetical protein [archaeon]